MIKSCDGVSKERFLEIVLEVEHFYKENKTVMF